jgi:hypothetical protein
MDWNFFWEKEWFLNIMLFVRCVSWHIVSSFNFARYLGNVTWLLGTPGTATQVEREAGMMNRKWKNHTILNSLRLGEIRYSILGSKSDYSFGNPQFHKNWPSDTRHINYDFPLKLDISTPLPSCYTMTRSYDLTITHSLKVLTHQTCQQVQWTWIKLY